MTDPRVAALVARYGWRFSNLDARRAGVPESALFDAITRGEAKIARTSAIVTGADGRCISPTVYLVLA